MNFTLLTYLVYLPLSIGAAWIAGQSLYKNGKAFLLEVSGGKAKLANSLGRLLASGFYLLTLGYLSLYMPVAGEISSMAEMLEVLSVKLGILLLILGGTHVLVMAVLFRMKHVSVQGREFRI
jgi:hypothetical protein